MGKLRQVLGVLPVALGPVIAAVPHWGDPSGATAGKQERHLDKLKAHVVSNADREVGK